MKTLSPLMVFLLALVLLWPASCGSRQEYDPELVAIDSVLGDDPAKALSQLQQMDSGRLARNCDRAYHALLLTQAQYRNYIVATSDSGIKIALDYFTAHAADHEKLTRAYIYMGAVMEELGHPHEAILYYKKALEAVAEDDNFNQGYVRLRMGYIYRDNIVADSLDITLFKQALEYFNRIPDSLYVLHCLHSIGSSYIKTNKDSMMPYLERAIVLARQLEESQLEQTCLRYMADVRMLSGKTEDIQCAKEIALSALGESHAEEKEHNHFMLIAAYTLAKQNKTDSAEHFLKGVERQELRTGLQVLYDKSKAELARCRGDVTSFQFFYDRANMLTDSLVKNDLQRQLRDIETKYDNETLRYEALRYKTHRQLALMGAVLAMSALFITMLIAKHKLGQRRRQLRDNEDTIERLRNDTARLANQLADNQAMGESLKETIRHQIDTFTALVETHCSNSSKSPKKFEDLFKKSYRLNKPDESFWSGIRTYVDSTRGGIITKTLAKHPSLSASDVQFLCLCCCDLPTTVIMACMGYNDVHSVYNKKRRLAEAINLPGKLDDYITGLGPSFDE